MTGKMEEEKGSCKFKWGDHRSYHKCRRPSDNGEYCIFHSKDIEGKKADFEREFWKEFDRQKKQEEKYDFIGFVFTSDISFEKIEFEKNVSFSAAQFFGKASFVEAQFSKDVNFRSAKFYKKAEFWEAQFSWGATFEEVKFSEEAYFDVAQFSGEVHFERAQFSGWTNFGEAQFSGVANFGGAQFSGVAIFMEAQFSGWTNFGEAQFSGVANFWKAQFSGEVYFEAAQFSGGAIFWGAQFSGVAHFWGAQFSGEADFTKAQFSGEADFGNAEFHSKSYFTDVKFEDLNQCDITDTSFYNVFDLLEYIAKNRNKFKHPKGIKYLHDKLRLILGEVTVSRLPLLSREIKDDIYLMSFKKKHPKLHFIWWLFADCGRSFLRWALWALGLALLFGLIYLFIGPTGFKPKPEGYTWFSFFYYSIVTFTTLGFGDITPIKWFTEILVTIEVILGYIMLGGLISILANKLARRS